MEDKQNNICKAWYTGSTKEMLDLLEVKGFHVDLSNFNVYRLAKEGQESGDRWAVRTETQN